MSSLRNISLYFVEPLLRCYPQRWLEDQWFLPVGLDGPPTRAYANIWVDIVTPGQDTRNLVQCVSHLVKSNIVQYHLSDCSNEDDRMQSDAK